MPKLRRRRPCHTTAAGAHRSGELDLLHVSTVSYLSSCILISRAAMLLCHCTGELVVNMDSGSTVMRHAHVQHPTALYVTVDTSGTLFSACRLMIEVPARLVRPAVWRGSCLARQLANCWHVADELGCQGAQMRVFCELDSRQTA